MPDQADGAARTALLWERRDKPLRDWGVYLRAVRCEGCRFRTTDAALVKGRRPRQPEILSGEGAFMMRLLKAATGVATKHYL